MFVSKPHELKKTQCNLKTEHARSDDATSDNNIHI